MRHLLLALIIVLLPLRGWAADMMAVEMATQTLVQQDNAIKVIATYAVDTGASGHPDCFGHQPASTQTQDKPSDHADGHCASCVSCQVCQSLALTPRPSVLTPSTLPHSAPRIAGATFTSASPAPGFKPPIS